MSDNLNQPGVPPQNPQQIPPTQPFDAQQTSVPPTHDASQTQVPPAYDAQQTPMQPPYDAQLDPMRQGQMPYAPTDMQDNPEEPDNGGSSYGWIILLIAGIVIIAAIIIWFFVVPHPENEVEQGGTVTEGIVESESGSNGDVDVEIPEGSPEGIGSNGPLTMINPNGAVWEATVVDLPSEIELHGVSDNGVTLAFMPGDSPQIDCRILSVELDSQTYTAGQEGTPLKIEITAGPEGARDITTDPTFAVGTNGAGGAYGQRVLFTIEGKSEADYSGLKVTIEETPEGGEPVTGTISLESE